MIVLAREVFVCKCATDVPREDPNATEEVNRVVWVRGSETHLAILPPEHHSKEHIDELRERLARGEDKKSVAATTAAFAHDWFTRHVKLVDMPLIEYIRGVR